jgi:hypothetical protein
MGSSGSPRESLVPDGELEESASQVGLPSNKTNVGAWAREPQAHAHRPLREEQTGLR